MSKVAIALAWGVGAMGAGAPPPNYSMMWKDFKQQFPKVYKQGEEEERFKIFQKNVYMIFEENAKGLSHRLGVNQFTDLTKEEFSNKYLGYKPELRKATLQSVPWVSPNITAPDSIDWVTKGGVTPVKNQEQCGSCWAFSTTGSTEGALFVATGKLVSLSEEDLVQCDHNGDQGCQGGLMDNAFDWIKTKGGICSESSYPYTSGSGTTGTCQTGCSPVMTLTGHTDVPSKDEDALKIAVAQQPVSIAIEADKAPFQNYAGGVLDSTACGVQLDHGVLIVGYGTDGGKDYWKIKNSWGASWGEQGYIRMVRGKNMCGLATQPSYPTGAKAVAPGPAPTPGPGPAPTPGPGPAPTPAPGCADTEDSVYCDYVKSQTWCDLLSDKCLNTCGCCVASPPTYCGSSTKTIVV